MPAKKQMKVKTKRERTPAEGSGEVLDLKGAAEFLKVSKPTFYRWLAQGKINGFKAGSQWRFYRVDLEKFLQAEDPSALRVDSLGLRRAVDAARKARGLEPIEWPETETPEETAVVETVNSIMRDAVAARASDIHIDVDRDSAVVRYRVDGVLSQVMTLPREASKPIVARMKLLGDMNISERRLPQNGRIHVEIEGREYDFRVTTMPAVFGESAIVRILDQSSVFIGLEKLGMRPVTRKALEARLRAPHGLIVVTGPTGSGRTTTLYSALCLMNAPERKTVTIEDPVEYQLRGTMQVHVNRKAGLTFGVGIRHLLRCDPDIILIGELRDLETAELCVTAALTGHLVLTAMLPTGAPEVASRLLEMGIEPFLVSAALSAALAQRLVRRVCPDCKTEDRPSAAMLKQLEAETGIALSGAKFHKGKGCVKCWNSGYRGRTGVFELLEMNDAVRDVVVRGGSAAEVRQAATETGMVSILQDGLEKAKEGTTTIEEVLRVLA